MDVIDPPDVRAPINQDASAQDAAINAPDAVPDIRLRANPDPVIGVDKRDVLDGIVVALQVKRPGIRSDVGDLLLGIPNRQAAHRGRVSHLEQGRAVFLLAASCRQYDRAFERFTLNG